MDQSRLGFQEPSEHEFAKKANLVKRKLATGSGAGADRHKKAQKAQKAQKSPKAPNPKIRRLLLLVERYHSLEYGELP